MVHANRPSQGHSAAPLHSRSHPVAPHAEVHGSPKNHFPDHGIPHAETRLPPPPRAIEQRLLSHQDPIKLGPRALEVAYDHQAAYNRQPVQHLQVVDGQVKFGPTRTTPIHEAFNALASYVAHHPELSPAQLNTLMFHARNAFEAREGRPWGYLTDARRWLQTKFSSEYAQKRAEALHSFNRLDGIVNERFHESGVAIEHISPSESRPKLLAARKRNMKELVDADHTLQGATRRLLAVKTQIADLAKDGKLNPTYKAERLAGLSERARLIEGHRQNLQQGISSLTKEITAVSAVLDAFK